MAANSQLGLISLHYNYENAVWKMPYGMAAENSYFQSFAAIVADVEGPPSELFPINYRIQLDSTPQLARMTF